MLNWRSKAQATGAARFVRVISVVVGLLCLLYLTKQEDVTAKYHSSRIVVYLLLILCHARAFNISVIVIPPGTHETNRLSGSLLTTLTLFFSTYYSVCELPYSSESFVYFCNIFYFRVDIFLHVVPICIGNPYCFILVY